jgi:hypothetical protein
MAEKIPTGRTGESKAKSPKGETRVVEGTSYIYEAGTSQYLGSKVVEDDSGMKRVVRKSKGSGKGKGSTGGGGY